MLSPLIAPDLLIAFDFSTTPIIVIVILRAPLVVSPPIKLTLYFLDASLRDLEKCSNQVSSNLGRVIASVKYFAVAPIAAISLKLTANDL